MKLLKFKLGDTIFSRLFVTFLVIMIPIYILGIYIYQWGLHTVKDEMSKSTISQVEYYLENLEKEIERIKILQYDCLNDEYLNKLAYSWDAMDEYERIECLRQFQRKLVTIRNSSIYIENVNAYVLPIRRVISSETGVDEIDLEKYMGIRIPPGMKGAQIIKYKGGLFLSTLQQNTHSKSNALYLIAVELNKDVIKQALAQFNTYKGSGSFLIGMKNNDMVMNQSDTAHPLPIESIIDNIREDSSRGMELWKAAHQRNYVIYAKSNYLNMILLRNIPEEYILDPIRNFYVWVWVFSIVVVAILLVFSLSTYKFIHKPLRKLVNAFRKMEDGDLQISIDQESNNEFGYLYGRFNDMTRNLNALIDQVYNQKILMQRAELKQLQSQINPHFLYNSFFLINTMARGHDDYLIPFTRYLGEYFRFVTRNKSDFIPLKDEMEHARVYTNIQSIRFSKRVQIQLAECPEAYANLYVPRLILQPIIENSFEYGIEKKVRDGIIQLHFEADKEELYIIIEDNGSELSDSSLAQLKLALENNGNDETTALINIHRRIKLFFGEECGLQISRSELGGLKVILKILISGGDKKCSDF